MRERQRPLPSCNGPRRLARSLLKEALCPAYLDGRCARRKRPNQLYGHSKPRKSRPGSWHLTGTCGRPPLALRSSGHLGPHPLTTAKDARVDKFVLVKPNKKRRFPALRTPFDGVDHASHQQALVHHLAEQPRLGQTTTPYRGLGERRLTRHQDFRALSTSIPYAYNLGKLHGCRDSGSRTQFEQHSY